MSKPWLVNIYIYVMSAYWLWREFWRELFGYKPTFLSEAASKMNFAVSRQRLGAWRKGIITVIMFLGCAVGSFCGGSLADHLSCKRLILYRVIIYALAIHAAFLCHLPGTRRICGRDDFLCGSQISGRACTILTAGLGGLPQFPGPRRLAWPGFGRLWFLGPQSITVIFCPWNTELPC